MMVNKIVPVAPQATQQVMVQVPEGMCGGQMIQVPLPNGTMV